MRLNHYILMSRIFFISCIFFLCTSFGYREPKYCKMADRITKDFVKEYAKPRHLMLTGYGGAMMGDIQDISLGFLSLDALNVDQARILYVELIQEYLHRINNDEKIRPHLHNSPFNIDNIKLDIGFISNNDGLSKKDGHVAFIFMGNNQTLFYEACSPETEDFYSLHREPYQVALELVKDPSHCTVTKQEAMANDKSENNISALGDRPLKKPDSFSAEEAEEIKRHGRKFKALYFNE